MTTSLYDATVRTFEQMLASTSGVLEKGAAHCRDKGVDPAEMVEARLYDDMAPLRFQIISVAAHSRNALEALRSGAFSPPDHRKPYDYTGLQALVRETLDYVKTVAAADVDGAADRDVAFKIGERTIPFKADDFLLSFSLPNFYFHATTAYDILRSRGVGLGKRDYLGPMRIKRA